jgi:hypothetical protein
MRLKREVWGDLKINKRASQKIAMPRKGIQKSLKIYYEPESSSYP